MSVFSRGMREKWARQHEPETAKRIEAEKAEGERAERDNKRLRKQVESVLRSEMAAIEADARLTPEQRERKAEQAKLASLAAPLSEQLAHPPARARGWMLMRETVLREWAEQKLEKREREQNLPARRDRFDAQAQEVEEHLQAALTEAREKCKASEQAAQSRAATDRAELGARPELKDEAMSYA